MLKASTKLNKLFLIKNNGIFLPRQNWALTAAPLYLTFT